MNERAEWVDDGFLLGGFHSTGFALIYSTFRQILKLHNEISPRNSIHFHNSLSCIDTGSLHCFTLNLFGGVKTKPSKVKEKLFSLSGTFFTRPIAEASAASLRLLAFCDLLHNNEQTKEVRIMEPKIQKKTIASSAQFFLLNFPLSVRIEAKGGEDFFPFSTAHEMWTTKANFGRLRRNDGSSCCRWIVNVAHRARVEAKLLLSFSERKKMKNYGKDCYRELLKINSSSELCWDALRGNVNWFSRVFGDERLI